MFREEIHIRLRDGSLVTLFLGKIKVRGIIFEITEDAIWVFWDIGKKLYYSHICFGKFIDVEVY